jgi:hypothetical protein
MNAAAFLTVADPRWLVGDAALQVAYHLHVRATDRGWYGHCQQVDLMVHMPDLGLLETAARLGICALTQLDDSHAPSLTVLINERCGPIA